MPRLTTFATYLIKRLKRLPLTLPIRQLVSWSHLGQPIEGYSIAIACMSDLAPVAIANLNLCLKMANSHLVEVILVFDCRPDQIPASVTRAVREGSKMTKVTLLGYNKIQHWVAKQINWGWVYSWLSWCLAIRHCRSRTLIVHDLDAMPLYVNIFEEIYGRWVHDKPQFCGIRTYAGNGVDEKMNLVTTFELILDVAFLRKNFRPFELFNRLKIVDDRVVDFDTMLYAQWRSPRRTMRPIDESQLVHPTQLICQYTELMSGRTDFQGRKHCLPMLAYLMHLGGDSAPLSSADLDLCNDNVHQILLFGRIVFIDSIPPEEWAWIEKQVRRIEQQLFGKTRPEVNSFLRGIAQRAGYRRTVGVESGPTAVPEL